MTEVPVACPECGARAVITPEKRVWSTAMQPSVHDFMKNGNWGYDWCSACHAPCEPTFPLITHVAELQHATQWGQQDLVIMIAPEDGPDWVDEFHRLMAVGAADLDSELLARLLTYSFEIVIGTRGFYELLNGISRAPRSVSYFPASYQRIGPPEFSVSPLKAIAKEYERAGRIDAALAMFERAAAFPVGDAEYLLTWGSVALTAGQQDVARRVTKRAQAIQEQTKHAWRVIIPQLSAIQTISPDLEPPILKAAVVDRFLSSEPEYQLSDHDLARTAGAVDREVVEASQVLNKHFVVESERRRFRNWLLKYGPAAREPLLAAYRAEGGSLDGAA